VTKEFLKGELQELKTSLLLWLFSMLVCFYRRDRRHHQMGEMK